MPSPFPGMDPYLEDPAFWPDFHGSLAPEIRAELNRILPPRYYASLETRTELGIVDEPGERGRIIPDLAVIGRPPAPQAAGGAAVATRPRREVSHALRIKLLSEMVKHHYIEIREPARGHKLVTLIEILSPSNKRSGPDREAYESKRREVLASDASLIELDLLRGGRRVLPDPALRARIERLEPSPSYLVLLDRAWRRGAGVDCDVYPIGLREPLPCIAVPLKQDEDEVALDLQDAFERAYDTGPYGRGAVDYAGPVPEPSLDEADAAWAADRTRPWREARTVGDVG